MNNTVAFIGLGAAACITAPAFAQDTHTSLTKQSVACHAGNHRRNGQGDG